jgi:hypothetical protein
MTRSVLAVIEPATDANLLTVAELRVAAGLADDDSSLDSVLVLQGRAASSTIASACRVRSGSGGQPTLLRETLVETFRGLPTGRIGSLVLARRHCVVVESIFVDESEIDPSDYVVGPEAGMVARSNGWWEGTSIEVTYRAGFLIEQPTEPEEGADLVPDDLRYAATLMTQQLRASIPPTDRDLLTRGITIEGVGSVQYATDSLSTSAERPLVPNYVMALLGRNINTVHA